MGLWENRRLSMIISGNNNKLFSILRKHSKKEIDEILFTSVIGIKENRVIIDKLKKYIKVISNKSKHPLLF